MLQLTNVYSERGRERESEGLITFFIVPLDTLRNNTPSTSNCNKYLEYVLDITIAYPNGKPLDLPNIIHGMRDGCQTYFFYRLYHYSEVSLDF